MKAIVQERFGPPDTLALREIDPPDVGPDDVLIKVRAASLNPYDWHMLRGDPRIARLMGGVGLTKPKAPVAGIDVAGRVEKVGANVHDLQPDDDVFGFCRGACAEFAISDRALVIAKPAGLTFQEAAAIPMGAVTALHAIRDVGGVSSGQRVLVNGAAGGVGIYAVQIAAWLGAHVTGVCSGRNVELVRSVGATQVIDYESDDFTNEIAAYDVILDNVGNHPLSRLRRTLTPTGTLVLNGGGSPGRIIGAVGAILRASVVNLFVRQKIKFVPTTRSQTDLQVIVEMIESGTLKPVIDRSFPLANTAEALRYVERGHTSGKVVITVP